MVFKTGNIPWNKDKTGVYDDERLKQMSESRKGHIPWNKGKKVIYSEETKKHLSEIRRGRAPWNKGKEGKKGIFHHTEETKQKMAEAKMGNVPWHAGTKGLRTLSEEGKRKIGEAHKGNHYRLGYKTSEETKHKIGKANKGNTSYWKGKHLPEETKKKISSTRIELGVAVGENNPAWMDGISFLPYCRKFNDKLKERIRNRDGRACQLCNIKENETLLSVHHIHYDKENCEPDLIALCRSCNARVNANRDHYEKLFMNKLIERGLATSTTTIETR